MLLEQETALILGTYLYEVHVHAVIYRPLHIVTGLVPRLFRGLFSQEPGYETIVTYSYHVFSLCLALTDVSQRQAALTVRDGEVEKESGKREEDLRSSVVTQATQKQ